MPVPNPVNGTQRRYNELCRLGGGQHGGPTRPRVQQLIHDSGRLLSEKARDEIVSALTWFPNSNPWHICFVVGLCWGRLARLEQEFIGAGLRLLQNWNDDDLRLARRFYLERGPQPIELSLRGGHMMFQRVRLPENLPDNLEGIGRAQQRWLTPITSPSRERPPFIGSWNATAMFMVAVMSQPELAAQLTSPVVSLPSGGAVFNALSILHRDHILARRPAGTELDDEEFEPGTIFENNNLFVELHRGHAGWDLCEVNMGLYMLGSRLAESDNWF